MSWDIRALAAGIALLAQIHPIPNGRAVSTWEASKGTYEQIVLNRVRYLLSQSESRTSSWTDPTNPVSLTTTIGEGGRDLELVSASRR